MASSSFSAPAPTDQREREEIAELLKMIGDNEHRRQQQRKNEEVPIARGRMERASREDIAKLTRPAVPGMSTLGRLAKLSRDALPFFKPSNASQPSDDRAVAMNETPMFRPPISEDLPGDSNPHPVARGRKERQSRDTVMPKLFRPPARRPQEAL